MKRSILVFIWSVGLALFGCAPTFAQGSWQTVTPMPNPRGNLAAGVVNGILYAVGGFINAPPAQATVAAYDPSTNLWSPKASMATPRNGVSVGVVNGILYAVGGDTDGGACCYLSTVEAYNATLDAWSPRSPMPTPRDAFGVGVINGLLYAVGGQNPNQIANSVLEVYDPTTDTWATKTPMPTPRFQFSVGVVNNILYVVGGQTANPNTILGTVEAYDPTTDTWTTKAPMLTVRQATAVAVVNGILYTIGGYSLASCSGFCAIVEAYDPTTDTWTAVTPMMPTPRYLLATATLNSSIYALGGSNSTGYLSTVEVFTPAMTPEQQIAALEALIESFNASQGIDNSLDAKLNAADAALMAARQNSTGTACNQLGAFINETQAQAGKGLTVPQSNQLVISASQIKATLGCS